METVAGNILIVDDEPEMCELLSDCLTGLGFACCIRQDSAEAIKLLEQNEYDVLIADISMPGINGLELLAHTRRCSPNSRVILITGFSERKNLAQAIELGAFDYLQKPFELGELTESVLKATSDAAVSSNLPIRAAAAMLSDAHVKQVVLESTWALVRAVEAKDPYTRRHSEQVTHYAVHLAKTAALGTQDINAIRLAALLHDVGKIGVPDNILTKPTSLTPDEFNQIRRHPALGADIIVNITSLRQEALLARHHHEHWDGRGYPDGLSGINIPLGSRIIHVADSIDAMLMRRSYKEGYPVDKMLGELMRCAGSQFDPEIVSLAVQWCRNCPEKLILPAPAAMTG